MEVASEAGKNAVVRQHKCVMSSSHWSEVGHTKDGMVRCVWKHSRCGVSQKVAELFCTVHYHC
jgi:hypothetical protein